MNILSFLLSNADLFLSATRNVFCNALITSKKVVATDYLFSSTYLFSRLPVTLSIKQKHVVAWWFIKKELIILHFGLI